MRIMSSSLYSENEINNIIQCLDTALQCIGHCNEDKDIVTCLTCEKRIAIEQINQAKKILANDSYLNEDI